MTAVRTTGTPPASAGGVPGPDPRPDRRGIPDQVGRRLDRVPLRVRLVAVVVVLLFVALTLTGTATVLLTRQSLMDSVDRELTAAAVPAAIQASSFHPPSRLDISNYAVRFMTANGKRVNVGQTSVSESRSTPDIPSLPLDDARVQTHEPFTVGSTSSGERWRVIAGYTDNQQYTFAVATPLTGADRTIRELRTWLVLIGGLVMVAGAAIGWYAVRRAFRPLAEIEDTAAAIAAGDLTRRVPEPASEDEVASLSRSLNGMLAQIEQSFAVREASEERMRQFVADASHELRTPLAAVRGYAELYRQGAVRQPDDIATAFRRIEDEATRMTGMVTDLLVLARLDQARPRVMTEVDLTVVAADAVQDARALDPTREVRLLGIPVRVEPTTVVGDESALRQVLTNLVGNAVNHTPAGTPFEVAVGTSPDGRAVLEVRDHGTGVDAAAARKIFERFYRADPSRRRGGGGGCGLGLAIVAAIVGAHDGRVGVARTPGGGATFVVDLPPAPTVNSQATPSTA